MSLARSIEESKGYGFRPVFNRTSRSVLSTRAMGKSSCRTPETWKTTQKRQQGLGVAGNRCQDIYYVIPAGYRRHFGGSTVWKYNAAEFN